MTREGKTVTLKIGKEVYINTLWIYVVDRVKRFPIREVTWVLSEAGETECWVGVYTTTPKTDETPLEV